MSREQQSDPERFKRYCPFIRCGDGRAMQSSGIPRWAMAAIAALAAAFASWTEQAAAQAIAAQSRATITIRATVAPRFTVGFRPTQPDVGPAILASNAPSLRVSVVSAPNPGGAIERGSASLRPKLVLIVPD